MASLSRAHICNLALAHIHLTDTTIANLDTDKGNVAVQCRIHYDVARKFVLESHPWKFATRRVALADVGSPPLEWAYRYDVPSDSVRVVEVVRDLKTEEPIPFEIEDDGTGNKLVLLTDKVNAYILYTRDVENVGLFSAGFVVSFGWYLASELSPALPGDFELQKTCLSVFQGTIGTAESSDSGQAQPDKELESPWERAR